MNLNVRPFTLGDAKDLIAWLPDVTATVQWGGPCVPFPIPPEFIDDLLHEQQLTPPKRSCWTALDAVTGQRAGHYQISYDWALGQATLCRVSMAPNARGRDLSRELVRHAVEQAFAASEVHRLDLRVYDFNAPAIRVYEQVGFIREGLLRESAPVGGERWNTVAMSILRPEFCTSRK